jgi:hypothetical protein
MVTVRVCYGDKFTVEWGYYLIATQGLIERSPLFSSERIARAYAVSRGYQIDESYTLLGHKR